MATTTYGWVIVSQVNEWRPHGPVISIPIRCKKHFLKACAAGAVIRHTEGDAALTCIGINRNNRNLSRPNYMKERIDKHWLYKPTNKETAHFNAVVIEEIMDV